ncbi:MAG: hypothetical protein EBU31_18430, partial [Proteobacteria bacterium]|nr:hypothetical protein [Pseudomonadota bacterium]
TVIVHGATLDHSKLLTQVTAENYDVWPDAHQQAEKYGLSWFGATNRYFALAIHAPYAQPSRPSKAIAPAVVSIQAQAGDGMDHDKPEQVVFTTCTSGAVTIAPGAGASFDMGVFAGPLERSLLGNSQPFAALNMHGLILYLMSGCCSFCTFSWLADFLVWFLSFLHDHVVFDWGLAIIVLVIVVRSIRSSRRCRSATRTIPRSSRRRPSACTASAASTRSDAPAAWCPRSCRCPSGSRCTRCSTSRSSSASSRRSSASSRRWAAGRSSVT